MHNTTDINNLTAKKNTSEKDLSRPSTTTDFEPIKAPNWFALRPREG